METAKYIRDTQSNYMSFTIDNTKLLPEYHIKMLSQNNFRYLIRATSFNVDNKTTINYDITSKRALVALYGKNSITSDVIYALMRDIKEMSKELSKYMLDLNNICLDMDKIMYDKVENTYKFIYYPSVEGDFNSKIIRLMEDIIQYVDYSDRNSVECAYKVYGIVKEDNFSFDDIMLAFTQGNMSNSNMNNYNNNTYNNGYVANAPDMNNQNYNNQGYDNQMDYNNNMDYDNFDNYDTNPYNTDDNTPKKSSFLDKFLKKEKKPKKVKENKKDTTKKETTKKESSISVSVIIAGVIMVISIVAAVIIQEYMLRKVMCLISLLSAAAMILLFRNGDKNKQTKTKKTKKNKKSNSNVTNNLDNDFDEYGFDVDNMYDSMDTYDSAYGSANANEYGNNSFDNYNANMSNSFDSYNNVNNSNNYNNMNNSFSNDYNSANNINGINNNFNNDYGNINSMNNNSYMVNANNNNAYTVNANNYNNNMNNMFNSSNNNNSNSINNSFGDVNYEYTTVLEKSQTTVLENFVHSMMNESYFEFVSESERRIYGGNIVLKDDNTIIGSNKAICDCVIDNQTISRNHIRVSKIDNRYYVTDLNSTNGTYINGVRFMQNETKEIISGDELMIGRIKLKFNRA